MIQKKKKVLKMMRRNFSLTLMKIKKILILKKKIKVMKKKIK